jgi:uncharacterized membrane protein YphA (DoxX/SURF4 family)
MAEAKTGKHYKVRFIISLAACIIIGLIFLVSSSGKLLDFGIVPGQTLDFVAFVIPESWLSQGMLTFLDIFIGWIFPLAELIVALCLLTGFFPRLVSCFVIPMSMVFMANNIFSLAIGMDVYEKCSCFGIWGVIFGSLTTVQSLSIDIVLFVLAIVVIMVTPIRFLSSQKWLAGTGKKKDPSKSEGK